MTMTSWSPFQLHRSVASRFLLVCAIGFAIPSIASGQEALNSPNHATETVAIDQLRLQYPEVRVSGDGFGRTILFGAPQTRGVDPAAALENWLEAHGETISLKAEDLELFSSSDLSGEKGTVLAYKLKRGSIPVEGGALRAIVRRDPAAGDYAVVYIASHRALDPEYGYPVIELSAEEASLTAREYLTQSKLNWFEPELVLTPSATLRAESRLAWHVRAHRQDADGHEAWSVIIDPTTGDLLELRDELIDVDIEGTVRARVTPPTRPDLASNPPVEVPLPDVQVRVLGGGSAITADDGSFTIPHSGTATVAIETSLVGPWANVIDVSGAAFVLPSTVTPPGPITLLYDAGTNPLFQAQINGFHGTGETHDFYRDRTATGIPGLDTALTCNVNINDVCNAFFDPFAQSINFFQAGSGCANTAFTSVVSHEYGHFVVNQLNLAQGAFGEGYGDAIGMLMYDDPIIGRDFAGPGTVVRDPVSANLQYPCSGQIHFCGQLLAGSWWDLRLEIASVLGQSVGLETVQQLFVDWSLLTIGGMGDSSAHPQTAIEVLTADDDDLTLDNGTPHFFQICNAFAAHSIDCPPVPLLFVGFPLGRPDTLIPGIPTEILVDLSDGLGVVDPSSAQLLVKGVGETGFTSSPLDFLAGMTYSSTIPAQSCGGIAEYYYSVQTTSGQTVFVPASGPADPFTAPVFDEQEVTFEDDMETATPWTAGLPTDTATTGQWVRVNPVGTAAAPGADNTPNGSLCWVTGQGVPGGTLGADDVDTGVTTLISPILDLSAPGDYSISYARWFSNDAGAQPNTEVFTISLSNNGGTTWSVVEVVGPTGPETAGGWFTHTFDVASVLPATDSMQLRFLVGDLPPGSIVEAGVDDLVVTRRSCGPPEPQFSRGDVTGDGSLNIGDVISILSVLFITGSLDCDDAGDTNDSGVLDLADPITLLDYLFGSGGGAPLPGPFMLCGEDPTPDALGCDQPPGICP